MQALLKRKLIQFVHDVQFSEFSHGIIFFVTWSKCNLYNVALVQNYDFRDNTVMNVNVVFDTLFCELITEGFRCLVSKI